MTALAISQKEVPKKGKNFKPLLHTRCQGESTTFNRFAPLETDNQTIESTGSKTLVGQISSVNEKPFTRKECVQKRKIIVLTVLTEKDMYQTLQLTNILQIY